MTRFRLAAIALFFAVSSNAWADLRTFDVGFEYRQEVYQALSNLLVNDPQFLAPGMVAGRVEMLDSGQIVVNASPDALDQVEQVIKAIRERPVAPTPRVTLRYWAVLGAQINAANAVGTAPPPVLGDVLTELERLNGDLNFRVVGSAAVTSNSGQVGEVSSTAMNVEQTVRVQGDAANAQIKIELLSGSFTENPAFGGLELQTTLRRREFVVVGESLFQGGALNGPVFFIVHWAE